MPAVSAPRRCRELPTLWQHPPLERPFPWQMQSLATWYFTVPAAGLTMWLSISATTRLSMRAAGKKAARFRMLITAQLLRLKTLSIIFIDLSARPGFPGRVFYAQTRAVELCRFRLQVRYFVRQEKSWQQKICMF